MSLTNIYVLADDDKLYSDPVLYGDDWFLCFDDNDPPEIVIIQDHPSGSLSNIQCRERALECMLTSKIEAKIISEADCSIRVFPEVDCSYDPNGVNDRIWGAAAFNLEVLKPIPADCLMYSQGNMTQQEFVSARKECVMYLFGKTLPSIRTSN